MAWGTKPRQRSAASPSSLGKGEEGERAGGQSQGSARQHRQALWVKERKENGLADKAKAALGSIAKLFG